MPCIERMDGIRTQSQLAIASCRTQCHRTRCSGSQFALGRLLNLLAMVLVAVMVRPAFGCEHGCEPDTTFYPSLVQRSYGSFGDELNGSENTRMGCTKTRPNGPYATQAPKIHSAKGEYLGKFSKNRYDHESLSNPYGKYGNKYRSGSLINPYSQNGRWSGRTFIIVPQHGEPEVVNRDQILRSLQRD